MMRFAVDLDHITTVTDIEAVLLEYTLIKKYQPPYNSRMKDSPHYHYINTTDVFAVSDSRGKNYVGPFLSESTANAVLAVVSDYFKIALCDTENNKPCLRYYIDQCICKYPLNIELYRMKMKQAMKFLHGKDKATLRILKKEMQLAADLLQFEKAASLRNTLDRLQRTSSFLQSIPPTPADGVFYMLLKSRHEEAFLWFHLENAQIKAARRYMTLEDWRSDRFTQLDEYYEFDYMAVLEIDAARYFSKLSLEFLHQFNHLFV